MERDKTGLVFCLTRLAAMFAVQGGQCSSTDAAGTFIEKTSVRMPYIQWRMEFLCVVGRPVQLSPHAAESYRALLPNIVFPYATLPQACPIFFLRLCGTDSKHILSV